MMDAESSAGPARAKRTSKRVLSDSEPENDDQSPTAGSAKKKKAARRVAPPSDNEDELDSDEAEDEDTPAGRQRLKAKAKGKAKANGNGNGNGAGSDVDMENGDDDDDEIEAAQPGGIRPEYQRGADGFVAGSIVRIKLINFMTYDHVEFKPGPHLNMILGPNGTGKSSIAAGIALGLGFNSNTMQRVDGLRGFVKQGCDEAQVEVEIKAFPGKKNPVIWRRFGFESDKSEYKLNGQPETQKAIRALVAGFGVQADNLCCFLPQDKVAKFAAMPPNDVLTATMKSAGDSRLYNWHEKLKGLGVEHDKLETSLETVKAERDNIQNQANGLEADVQHFQERAGLQKEEKVLECLLIAANRCNLLRNITIQKARKLSLKREMAKRVQRSKPIQELQTLYQKKLEDVKARCDKAEKTTRKFEKDIQAAWREISDKEDSVRDIKLGLEKIKSEIKREEKTRATYMKRKQDAQAILDKPVEDVQAQIAEYTEARKEAAERTTIAKRDYDEITRRYGDAQNEMSECTKAIENKTRLLERHSSIIGQKEDMARQSDGTLNFVLKWLSEHEAEFDQKVYPPPLISVNLKDRKYANQVEAGTNWGQRCTFIVQNKNDYNRMLQLNRMKFGPWQHKDTRSGRTSMRPGGDVRIFVTQVSVDEQSLNPQKPCSQETLHGLGFAGWAIDFVEAEKPVIAFLNEKCNFSRLAITLKNGDQINADATQRAGITRWVTATDVTSAGRSRYGKQDVFMSIQHIKPASSFNIVVDHAQVTKLQEEITKLKRQKRDAEEPLDEHRLRQGEAREKGKAIEQEAKEIADKLSDLRSLTANRTLAAKTLKRADEDLAKLGNPESYETRRAVLHAKLATNLKDRVEMVVEALKDQEQYLVLSTALTKRKMEQIQIAADVKAIAAQIETTHVDISDLETAINNLTQELATAMKSRDALDGAFKKRLNEMRGETDAVTSRLGEVEVPADDVDGQPTLTPDQITDDLQAVRMKISLSVGVEQDTVDRYHGFIAQLEGLKKNTDKQSKLFEKVRKEINSILVVFEPALDDLVDVINKEFSRAFELVGCTGEVQLDRAGQYDQWGIKILVSYRNDEPLAVLTSSVQSGGERSLATITYLMSLSSMSRTPFSLVDEINQGMDQRAERNVHNQLVDVTCGHNAGQYFLITPKLLTDLTYHPKMKILNVNNGMWLPEPDAKRSQEKWADFKGCIQTYRNAKGMGRFVKN